MTFVLIFMVCSLDGNNCRNVMAYDGFQSKQECQMQSQIVAAQQYPAGTVKKMICLPANSILINQILGKDQA